MKVFKMLHLNIYNGSIVQKIGTLHKVAQGGAIFEHNNHDVVLKIMIPQMNNLDKKQAWSSQNILNPT